MAQFVVRHLEDEVKACLKRRAECHGSSMEEEIRQILRNAAKEPYRAQPKLGSRIAARFSQSRRTTECWILTGPQLRQRLSWRRHDKKPAGQRMCGTLKLPGLRWRGMRRW
ncbi:MAG: Arc family DNA-binding protein [Burkholderiales bacterium]|nr:Arc family DNA-binding protein [Burkholderiales bacterium]MDP2397037.1 Arc family DNA-binding protein [Burkholderiales bacterium]